MHVPGRRAARRSVSAHARAAATPASPAHRKWLANIDRRAVPPQAVADIVRQHGITKNSFRVLDSMGEINDPDGKSFFLIPKSANGDDARAAAVLSYLLNADTGYGRAGQRRGVRNDFAETPYSATEVRRIIDRQRANRWSYDAVRAISNTGGRLVATPNGVLMGLGGNWIHGQFSRRGGTMWGDIFMVNTRAADPAGRLCDIVASGRVWQGGPALDRVLHHEEIHAQQWAARGISGMAADYAWELFRENILHKTNRLELAAGLRDGGYR